MMVTIFTEDGRVLKFDDDEMIHRLGWNCGSYKAEGVEAKRIERGDNILLKGNCRRRDRENDVAFVQEVAIPYDAFWSKSIFNKRSSHAQEEA